jgi:predicted P-loop ATPase
MIPEWLAKYNERGFKLVFFPTKRKGPITDGWETKEFPVEDYTPGLNVGIKTGVEIQPGKYLVDVDFDDEFSAKVAKIIFAEAKVETEFGFGRGKKKLTHAFFTTDTPPATVFYDNLKGERIIEIRGLAKDGTIGFQTMVPPSIHPEGETLQLALDGAVGHAPTIHHLIKLISIGSLLLYHFGSGLFTHDVRMAVAGFLLKCGLDAKEVTWIEIAICQLTGNNKHDAETSVQSTAARIKQGEVVTAGGALAKMIGAEGRKVTGLIKKWLGVKDFITNKEGVILKDKEHNIRTALENLGVDIQFDDFAQKTNIKYNGFKGPLADYVRNRIYMDVDAHFHFKPLAESFDMVLLDIAHHNKIHPVKEYLDSLVWDGIPRVNRFFIECADAVDHEYVEQVTKIFMLAAVRRIRQPGCKLDEMVVLESPQGVGKSSALRALCPNEDWFSDDFPMDIDSKEVIERTGGKWIIECAELAGARKAQAEHMKSMISRQRDGPVRMAYMRFSVEVPRQFVVIGTTNSKSYLKDETGGRRFWPLTVKKFDLDWIKENRDQLWAEANAREANGESIRLPKHLWDIAGKQQEHRRIEDPWEVILNDAFEHDKKHRIPPEIVWEALSIPVERRDSRAQERVNNAMQRLGFRRMTVQDDTKRIVKGYGRDPQTGNLELEYDA